MLLNIDISQADINDPVFARPDFSRQKLTLHARGESHVFHVEVAKTPAQQSYGLMFRRELAKDSGMLFTFERDAVRRMWMKNTKVPLDILFIDPHGGIIYIAENAEPESTSPIGPEVPVHAVLEVPGGTAQRLGIHPGDKVTRP